MVPKKRSVPVVANRVPNFSTPPFPTAIQNKLVYNARFQTALDHSIQIGPGRNWEASIFFIALESNGTRPFAEFHGSGMHFSGSLLKVGAMFAAFQLRHTLQKMAQEGLSTKSSFLKDAYQYLKPKIKKEGAILPLYHIKDTPLYPFSDFVTMFGVSQSAGDPSSLHVDFTGQPGTQAADRKRLDTWTMWQHLEGMISVGTNPSAGQCIRKLGYGYLNGSLHSAGFFDPLLKHGIWLAGDYVHRYPYFRIVTLNDGDVAQATSAKEMARLLMLIHDHQIVDGPSCTQMMKLLRDTVSDVDRENWHTWYKYMTNVAPNFDYSHTKQGLSVLKKIPPGASTKNAYSEGSIIKHRASGKKFVVVWQNLQSKSVGWNQLVDVLNRTLDGFVLPMYSSIGKERPWK
jgi:hypothetical protein